MTAAVRSICPFCSMGCSLLIEAGANRPWVGERGVPSLDYDLDGPFNRGSLCAKGNMALEVCTHPRRLESPRLRTSAGAFSSVSQDDAMTRIVEELLAIRRESGPGAIGVYLGPCLTNEEVRRAAGIARLLGTPNVDGGAPEDQVFLGGIERSGAAPEAVTTVEAIESMTAVLCVGDVFSIAPCLSKAVLDARYDRRGNRLGTLSGSRNRTTWFGKPELRCRPAQKATALALMLRTALEELPVERPWARVAREVLASLPLAELEALAGLARPEVEDFVTTLAREEQSGVLAGAIFGNTDRSDLTGGLAALLAEATGSRFLAVGQGPNAFGLRRSLAEAGYPDPAGLTGPEMLEAAVTGDLKALLCCGVDPLAALPGSLPLTALEQLRFRVVTAAFPGGASDRADVVLPSLVFGEKAGTVTNAFGADLSLGVALRPPGIARSELDILDDLGRRLAARNPEPRGRVDGPVPHAADPAERTIAFLADLELYVRERIRIGSAHEVGSHLLLPRASACHAGDGSLTRHLSWPRHENPRPEAVLSCEDARELGVADGDDVILHSAVGEARLVARVEASVPPSIVFAPSHEPSVRHLMRWRLDPGLRNLDLRPGRISVMSATRRCP